MIGLDFFLGANTLKEDAKYKPWPQESRKQSSLWSSHGTVLCCRANSSHWCPSTPGQPELPRQDENSRPGFFLFCFLHPPPSQAGEVLCLKILKRLQGKNSKALGEKREVFEESTAHWEATECSVSSADYIRFHVWMCCRMRREPTWSTETQLTLVPSSTTCGMASWFTTKSWLKKVCDALSCCSLDPHQSFFSCV